VQGGQRRAIVHLGQQDEAARALDEGADGGAMGGSLNEIALAVAWHLAIRHLGWAHMNQNIFTDKPGQPRQAASHNRQDGGAWRFLAS